MRTARAPWRSKREPQELPVPASPRVPVPKPANDNLPRPANDNEQRPSKGRFGRPSFGGLGNPVASWAAQAIMNKAMEHLPEEWLPRLPAQAGGFAAPGFQHVCTTNCATNGNTTGGPSRWNWVNTVWAGACNPGTCSIQVNAGSLVGTGSVPAAANTLIIYAQATGAVATHMRRVMNYARVSPGIMPPPGIQPGRVPQWQPEYEPIVPTWIDPLSTPPGVWTNPVPPPYWATPHVRPNPQRHPDEQPSRNPGRARPSPRPRPRPGISEAPNANADGFPEVTITPSDANGSYPSPPSVPPVRRRDGRRPPRRPPSWRKPPKKNEVQRKWSGSNKFNNAFRGGINAVTEANDLVDAFWDALPPWHKTMIKGKKTTPQQKAQDIWNAYKDPNGIDWDKYIQDVAKNVAMNEVGDRVAGAVNAGRASRNNPVFNGGAGPWRGYETGPAL